MAVDYCLLGPLEASVDGRPAAIGGPKQKAVLALLLAEADYVVPAGRLVDALWGDDPPSTATNLVQGAVSHLRKALGRSAIETRGSGYALRLGTGSLDVRAFERLAGEGSRLLADGQPAAAAGLLSDALGLWRGPPLADLADEPGVQPLAGRLEELRTLASERRLEADLACGRHAEVVAEATHLVREHPLRERPRGLLMLALYGAGRQAEALDAYREARETLVRELGIEPSPWLRELETSILRQEPAAGGFEPSSVAHATSPLRSITLAVLAADALDSLLALGEPLARDPVRELVIVQTVASAAELAQASSALRRRRDAAEKRGVDTRVAAFTSLTPGADITRLVSEHDADLLLIDAPDRLLEDARLVAVLRSAPCDVGVLVGGAPTAGPVLVPFAGGDHDWAAVELGAWLARNRGEPLLLAGATTGSAGRDASRLLASVSLAVQRALGVAAEPVLVEPLPEQLVAAADGTGVVVVGLTDRWQRDGLGHARTAIASRVAAATVIVRRGVRPGGLAPRETETRFTWTIAG